MARNVEIQPLFIAGRSLEEQLDIAREVQRFVYEDFLRVGATEEEARSIADPDNDDRVVKQLERITHRPRGTMYSRVIEDGDLGGIVKIGPWLPGDAAPFGAGQRLASYIQQFMQPLEALPRGLHVFAVRDGLALAALQAVRSSYAVESHLKLNAAVHENDDELHQAFTELGAPKNGPTGRIKLGNYAARYTLRSLPPEEDWSSNSN
jgi:hypothetical protein